MYPTRTFPTKSLIRWKFQYLSEKNHSYQKYQEHLFCWIIIPKTYEQIYKKNNKKSRNLSFFSFWMNLLIFRIHINFSISLRFWKYRFRKKIETIIVQRCNNPQNTCDWYWILLQNICKICNVTVHFSNFSDYFLKP